MKLLKSYQLWLSLVFGLIMFGITFPFYHDMYIAQIHTAICICLNLFSSILFGFFLYFLWTKRIDAENRAIFFPLTLVQAIGHGIFAIMNWGSFLFLALSALVIIILAISYFKEKK